MNVENLSKSGIWRLAVSFLLLAFLLGSAAATPVRDFLDDTPKSVAAEAEPESLLVLDRVPLEAVARRLNRRRLAEAALLNEFPSEIFARNSRNANSDGNAVSIRNIGDLPMFRFGRR
ncbi:hypothetical protein QR680_017061 [Steinernema hermaphroditum]|uniref:Uncharacterized protein n=1 Tax=Steinernema hermaphroditum TaxID=289476 RepID=A0AA39HD63_9BILA|nr:hypothetical protein QR680_017061 [Steinernema hermaphroditum]